MSAGAEEYKVLFRKYALLERSIQEQQNIEPIVEVKPIDDAPDNEEELVSILRNTYEIQQENQEVQLPSTRASLADIDEEVRKCPVCYWEFPKNLNVDGKREHIEQHFT